MEHGHATNRMPLRLASLIGIGASFLVISAAHAQFPNVFPVPSPSPVIDVADEFFGATIPDQDSAWVEGEVVEAELIRKIPARQGFGGNLGASSLYRIRLQVRRKLFGAEVPIESLLLKEVNLGGGGRWVEGVCRPPKSGDQVFARLLRDKTGEWSSDEMEIPQETERRRIDRMKCLIDSTDYPQVAHEMLAGCGDSDVDFALWCIHALTRVEGETSYELEKAYSRIWSHAPLPLLRTRLLQVLEMPETSDSCYLQATLSLKRIGASTDEADQFHQANCWRLQKYLSRSRDSLEENRGAFFAVLCEYAYYNETDERRRDILQILSKCAASQSAVQQAIAFRSASSLYSEENETLNDEILGIYRDHRPCDRRNYSLVYEYWTGLKNCMHSQAVRHNRIYDAGLEAFERELPAANAGEMRVITDCLARYAEDCRRHTTAWNQLSGWLQGLPALATTPDQRDSLEKMLLRLQISPANDRAT
ncbi:hypothetical protein LOC68_18690 [Blastopirellula sp. JC732]|uniref:HEAT repeat domain-containing protein n=1 Tax=Blastopirellula sediminis TaxID=2894196 RepID=A0A9X1MQY9_9BACT|nr:hypothetical protein [Blastopirellula sediminis]MCC9606275.1 hypothetical protein [Blastopirellula sediminis]MCC9630427.1 hypothetical protein [Blastopirellula sediminis]